MADTKNIFTASEADYRNIVANANEMIVVVQDGVVKFVNNKVEQITGYSATELSSQPFLFRVHPEDQAHIQEIFSKSISGEPVPSYVQFRILRKDGETAWMATNGVLINWQGKPATLGLISDITERVKLENELKDYLHRIIVIQEEERKRIAYELHDDTGQYLALLKMQLTDLLKSGIIQNPKVAEKIRYLERDAQRTLESVSRVSHALRPAILDSLGLQAALEQLIQDYQKLGQLSIEMSVRGSEPDLSEGVKLGFFRIAQEAFNNSVKHSDATVISISLNFTGQELQLSIQDNGNGFNIEEAARQHNQKGSLGLTTMKERAKLINANLEILSQPCSGTTVTVTSVLES